jgi:hypothetical protein
VKISICDPSNNARAERDNAAIGHFVPLEIQLSSVYTVACGSRELRYATTASRIVATPRSSYIQKRAIQVTDICA